MKKEITLNFGSITEELKNNELRLCFYNNSFYVEDKQKNLYGIDIYYAGSYLDKLIKDEVVASFTLVENKNIIEYNKKVWEESELEAFYEKVIE